jgi:uncharacterized membrane protein YeaQ/YmgE (transglycosylase-associated protein family)
MTLFGLLLFIVVGAICGIIAELIIGFSPGGLITSAVIGVLGAMIGAWLAPRLGLPSVFAVQIEGHTVEFVWTVLGSIVLLAVVLFVRSATKPALGTT